MKNLHPTNLFILLLAFLLLGTYACDYPLSKEHISNLEPPPDAMEVELSFLNAGDTLQLFSPGKFWYNFIAIHDQFLYGRFVMGPKEWEVNSISGTIHISPDDFPPGYNTIYMQVYFRSGSGSLADQSGAETYLAERSWTILCDSRPTPLLNLSHHKNENGFLTLTWTPHENYNFESYSIERTGYNIPSFDKTFSHRDSLTFVDSCYFAGHAKYTIRAKSKGTAGWGGADENSSVELNLGKPIMDFEMLSLDSIRISWQQPLYHALHNLTSTPSQGDSYILYAVTDTTVVVPMPLFGLTCSFKLTSYPTHGSNCSFWETHNVSQWFYPGERLVINSNATYAYNINENVIYTIDNQKNLLSYGMESMNIINSYLISDYSNHAPTATNLNSTTVAALGRNHFYIFSNSYLQNPVVIHFQNNFIPLGFLSLTQNGFIANAHSSHLRLFHINSGQMVASLPYPPTQNPDIAMSADASFAAFIGRQFGLWIYQNNNFTYEEAIVNQLPYTAFLFHPTLPDRIFLIPALANILELRTLPDFTLEQSWQLPHTGMAIGNIDPYTGYMLLFHSSEKQIILLNLETNEQVLSIRSSDVSPRFFKHRLFSRSGFTFDLSDYLP